MNSRNPEPDEVADEPQQFSVRGNSIVNTVGFVVVTVLSFVLTPITFAKLGQVDYGIWVFVISLLSYSSILYLGFGTTLVRYVAKYVAEADYDELGRLTGTVLVAYLLLGIATLLVAIGIAIALPFVIDLPRESQWMYQAAVIVVGVQLGIAFPFNVYGGILIGMQRYFVINAARIAGAVLTFVGIVLISRETANVLYLSLLFLLSGMVENFTYLISARRTFPKIPVRLGDCDFRGMKHLVGFSVSSLFVLISDKIVELTDTLVVGMVLGPAAVALYSIPQRLVQYLQMLALKASEVFLPRISELHARNDHDAISESWFTGYRYMLALCFPIGLVFLFYGDVFQVLWMGETFRQMHTVLIVLTVAYFFHMPISAAFLLATGNHRVASLLKLLGAVLNIVVSLVLVYQFEMLGVALAAFFPGLIGSLVLPALCCRYLNVSFLRFFRQSIWPSVAAAVPAVVMLYLLKDSGFGAGIPGFVIVCALTEVVFLLGFVLLFDRKLGRAVWHRARGLAGA
jgi:O-antigen/teichoic acid export membrane protein